MKEEHRPRFLGLREKERSKLSQGWLSKALGRPGGRESVARRLVLLYKFCPDPRVLQKTKNIKCAVNLKFEKRSAIVSGN